MQKMCSDSLLYCQSEILFFFLTDTNLFVQSGTGTLRVGVETPEEMLTRIALGNFGGANAGSTGANNDMVNGTPLSGGGNYSPPELNDFPLEPID